MRRLLAFFSVLLLALTIGGCKRGPLPPQPGEEKPAQVDEQQQKILEDILKFQRETGGTLQSLAEEVKRRRAAESQQVGPSPLQRDLAVARSLLTGVRRAAQSEDAQAAGPLLARLAAVLTTMQGELPAARIGIFLERAALALQGSSAGIEADVASSALMAALDVALQSPDAPLVPDVADKLQKAKAQVDKGDYKPALKAIEGLIGVAAGHVSVKMLNNAAGGVRGARDALAREAWLVLLAEVDQLSDTLGRFGSLLKAVPPAEAEQPAPEAPEASNELAPSSGAETGAVSSPPSPAASTGATPPAAASGPSAP